MMDAAHAGTPRFRFTAEARRLERACIALFQAGEGDGAASPRADRDSHQVLESTLSALGWMYMDLGRAVAELESVVELQQPDGRIPPASGREGAALPLLGSLLGMLYHSAKMRDRRLEGRLAALLPPIDLFHRFLSERDREGLTVSAAGDEQLAPAGGGSRDVAVNAVLVQAESDLADVAVHVGFPTRAMIARRTRRAMAIADQLWCGEEGIFATRDPGAGWAQISALGLAPLWCGAALSWQAEEMAQRYLDRPGCGFWTGFPLATLPVEAPGRDPRRRWQGATSLLVNWMVSRGAYRYGLDRVAHRLEELTLRQLADQGLYLTFDSESGRALEDRPNTAAAALALDLLKTACDAPRPNPV